jgi:pimeloyl-ACP methyl ester carboxylesterase
VSVPHPVRFAQALRSDLLQVRMSSYVGFFQTPKVPESRLIDGDLVAELLDRWGGPGFPDAETESRCREAMAIPAAAHCALEYFRWSVRSLVRPSGQRYLRLLAAGVQTPVLHLHGALDGCIRATSVHGSGTFAHRGYDLKVLDGVGHFPHQEAPDLVTELLLEHARA